MSWSLKEAAQVACSEKCQGCEMVSNECELSPARSLESCPQPARTALPPGPPTYPDATQAMRMKQHSLEIWDFWAITHIVPFSQRVPSPMCPDGKFH
jgi:hypothetical protein